MKITLSSFLLIACLGIFVVGCGSGEPRRSTDGADAQAIADYEAAVAEAEGNMATNMDSDAGDE